MADYRVVTACRLCDSTELAEVLNLGETPLANELDGTELFPLVMNRCGSCGHHQLSIAVSPERLWGPTYPYQSGTSPVFRAHLEKLADEVAALKPGGRVLEIASNDGTLVKMLAGRGCSVVGVDPSGTNANGDGWHLLSDAWPPDMANIGFQMEKMMDALTKAGIQIQSVERVPYDVILALNVMAHVDDLHAFTAAVKEALAPDGVFIVEVGNFDLVCERGHFDTVYHEHFSYHTRKPLETFFLRHGLIVERWENNESQGGSLRGYVRHD